MLLTIFEVLAVIVVLYLLWKGFCFVCGCGLALLHVLAPVVICVVVAGILCVVFGNSSHLLNWLMVGGAIGAVWMVATRFRVLVPILLCAGAGVFFGWILGAFWIFTIIGICGGVYFAAK